MTPDELRILEDRKLRVREITITRLSRHIEKLFGEKAPLEMAEVKAALLSRQKEDRAKAIKEALSHLTPEDITLALDTLFPEPVPCPEPPPWEEDGTVFKLETVAPLTKKKKGK